MSKLSFNGRWITELEQSNDVDTSGCLETAAYHLTSNIIRLNLTAEQCRKMLSSIEYGSTLIYPDESHEITDLFYKGLICPDELQSETDECLEYPLTSPFIRYTPIDPYTNPGEIPNGWLSPPFTIYDGGGSLPPGYLAGDIIVPISSFTLDPFDLFAGNLPTVKIQVRGSGQVELDLLATAAGGQIAISLNGSPSVFDIINGSISPDVIIMDSNLDTGAFPPEDDVSVQHEIDINVPVGTITDVFITFIPVLQFPSLTPVRFGGGIRSVQLCGFEQEGILEMPVRVDPQNLCMLQQQQLDGTWLDIVDLTTCGGGGGGGGGLAIAPRTYTKNVVGQTFTNNVFEFKTGTAIQHTFSASKALVIATFSTSHNGNVNNYVEWKLAVNNGYSVEDNFAKIVGTQPRTAYISGYYENIPTGAPVNVSLHSRVNAGTGVIWDDQDIVYTVIELADSSAVNLAQIEADINALQASDSSQNSTLATQGAAINSAQSKANQNEADIVTINNVLTIHQNDIIQNQNNIVSLQDADVVLSDAITDHEARIQALENAPAPSFFDWSYEFDFTVSDGLFTPTIGGNYVANVGWQAVDTGGSYILSMQRNNAEFGSGIPLLAKLDVEFGGAGLSNFRFDIGAEDTDFRNVVVFGSVFNRSFWYKMNNEETNDYPFISSSSINVGRPYTITKLTYFGFGDAPNF